VIALPEWVIGIDRNGRSAWPESAPGERAGSEALRAFLRDVTRMKLVLPGDPDRRRLRWVLK
jgi:hypothetical protein